MRGEPGADAAVVDVAAHRDAHAADERRIAPRTTSPARSVHARQVRLHVLCADRRRSGVGALDDRAVCRSRSSRTSAEIARGSRAHPACPSRDDASPRPDGRRRSSSAPSTRQSRNSCCASRCVCLSAFRVTVIAHGPPAAWRFPPPAALIVRRQHLADDRRRRLHDEAPDFAAELGEHAARVRGRWLRAP